MEESEKRDYSCPDERVSTQADFVSPKSFVFGNEDPIINESGEYEEEEQDTATTSTNTTPCSTQIALGENESTEGDLNADDVLRNAYPTPCVSQSSFGIELENILRLPSVDNVVLSIWGAEEFLFVSDHFKLNGALSFRSELKPFPEVSLSHVSMCLWSFSVMF